MGPRQLTPKGYRHLLLGLSCLVLTACGGAGGGSGSGGAGAARSGFFSPALALPGNIGFNENGEPTGTIPSGTSNEIPNDETPNLPPDTNNPAPPLPPPSMDPAPSMDPPPSSDSTPTPDSVPDPNPVPAPPQPTSLAVSISGQVANWQAAGIDFWAYALDGSLAIVHYTQNGVGVRATAEESGPSDEIDSNKNGHSERLVMSFGLHSYVTSIQITIYDLLAKSKLSERGSWQAYDLSGHKLGEGIFGSEILTNTKLGLGTFTIQNIGKINSIVFTALSAQNTAKLRQVGASNYLVRSIDTVIYSIP